MRSRVRLLAPALVALGLALASLAGSSPQPTGLHESADAHLFDPSSIISDDLFFNGSAMNPGEVQAFLDAMGVNCRTGTDGTPCVKNYRQDTTDRAGDQYCGPYAGRPQETAADIITKAGQACGISQKVLLVILQKEQSLVTTRGGDALYARRYREAMGYACPDNGTCNPAYNGFANQVYSAARRFQVYAKNPTSYAHRPGMTVDVRYYPEGVKPEDFNYQSRDCGKLRVYIRNQATAGLYNYTPYVPNRAALDAAPGTGDRCSTYGNRNFFLYYSDWFGNAQSGASSVTEKYTLLKASGVDLGAATSPVVCDQPNGGCRGSWQHGTIFWSQYTGAHVVRGAILQHFIALGGVPFLGYPTGDDSAAAVNPATTGARRPARASSGVRSSRPGGGGVRSPGRWATRPGTTRRTRPASGPPSRAGTSTGRRRPGRTCCAGRSWTATSPTAGRRCSVSRPRTTSRRPVAAPRPTCRAARSTGRRRPGRASCAGRSWRSGGSGVRSRVRWATRPGTTPPLPTVGT